MIPPVPMIFGIKLRTIVLMFWALFFGLIFTMVMWPKIWRKIYEKKRLENIKMKKNGKNNPPKKTFNFKLFIVIFILMIALFFLGSLFGFNEAIDQFPVQKCGDNSCIPMYCSDLGMNTCQDCGCFVCDSFIKVEIPIPNP